MARRSKLAAGSGAASSKSGVAAPTLVEAKHTEDAGKKKGGRKAAESFDSKVNAAVLKCLRDNFAHLTDEEQRVVRIDGATLVERLSRDKVQYFTDRRHAPALGKRYYDSLRSMYSISSYGGDALDPRQDGETIDAALIEAVRLSRSHGGSRQPLTQWLQTFANAPNQSEICGLFRHALELRPHLGGTHMSVLKDIMTYIRKHNLVAAYPAEFGALKSHLDHVLTTAYTQMKSKGFSPVQYWSSHKKWADLVCPVATVERLLAVQGSWAGHYDAIAEVVGSSLLGAKMFGFAAETSSAVGISAFIDSEIKQRLDGVDLTVQHVDDVKTAILKECQARSTLPKHMAVKPRDVELVYRGEKVVVVAESMWEEICLRTSLYVKLAAMGSHKEAGASAYLIGMFCENDLKPLGPLTVRAIEEELFATHQSARASANSQLTKTRHAVGEHVMQFMEEHLEVLLMIDGTLVMEAAFFSDMFKSGCSRLLQASVLAELPDGTAPRDGSLVAAAVELIKGCAAYTFADADTQTNINVVVEWAKALALLRKPTFLSANGNAFLSAVQARLKHMLQVAVKPDMKHTCEKLLTGEAALRHLLTEADEKAQAGTGVDMQTLKALEAYSWLLTAADTANLAIWVKAAFARAGSSSTVAKGSVESGVAETAKQTAKRVKAEQDLADATMAPFKKKAKASSASEL